MGLFFLMLSWQNFPTTYIFPTIYIKRIFRTGTAIIDFAGQRLYECSRVLPSSFGARVQL
jgi:hypothetical protein